MPTPTKGPRLGSGPSHERLMLANLATSLFEYGRITTTETKAKRLRPLAERLITFAKRGDIHARRRVLTVVRDKAVVHTLFAEIGPGFADRQGGYTRITKVGPRKGDNAPMAVIELVEFRTVAQEAVAEAEAARGTRFARRRRPTGATAEAAAELAGESDVAAGVAADAEAADAEAANAAEAEAAEAGDSDAETDVADADATDEVDAPEAVAEEPTAEAAESDGRFDRWRRRRHPRGVTTANNATEPATPTGDGGLVRLRLDLSYDGTDFSGWARQPGRRTVAEVVEAALATVLQLEPPLQLTVAGRTDAGVHATGQVAHVDVPTAAGDDPVDVERLAHRIAGLLPDDVALRALTIAPAGFDARFAAIGRRYAYRVTDAGPNPLRRHDTLAWPRPLDVEAMNQAAKGLPGEHDFAAYCRPRAGATTIRTLHELNAARDADEVVVISAGADAFCHNQVRSMVGALLTVGEGRRPPGWPAELLRAGVRDSGVNVAPAHGLTLVAVDYPPDRELAARVAQTRQRRSLPDRSR